MRRVARGLRPPALDELGLVGALRQVAHDVGPARRGGVDLPQLSPAVEVAAYRIGAEALTNVARHAGTTEVELRCEPTTANWCSRVVDHGRGSAAAPAGVGMLAMRERAEELGGTLRDPLTRAGGGTTVEARLPASPRRSAAR